MTQYLQYALLGIGIGGAYAVLALGVVAIYRGTAVPNFAQGAIAMITAYLFFGLRDDHGVPAALALAITLTAGGIIGGAFYFLVMRQLRTSPVLARLVATLALVTLLQGVALLTFDVRTKSPRAVLPEHIWRVFGIALTSDRLALAGVAILIALALAIWSRTTRTGLSIRALGDSEKGVQLLGYSPAALGALTWIIGSVLAALAGVLVSPLSGLDATALTLIVVPVFGAALIGRFTSFGITVLAAFAIGIGQSILQLFDQAGPWYTFLWAGPGRSDTLPALVIVAVMVLSGRLLPQRGSLTVGRMPLSARPRHLLIVTVVCLAIAVPMVEILPRSWVAAVTTSLLGAIVALSLVAVTGYLGQISLAQIGFAGFGALVAARLSTSLAFPLPVLAAALSGAVMGVLVGLPALRVRGPSLAIVTLSAAFILDKLVFENRDLVSGGGYAKVPAPALAGMVIDFRTYAVIVLVIMVVLAVAIGRLRRSRTGRRLLAVRENEAAAIAAGVNVAAMKLLAFSISAFIAGAAGGLMAYDQRVFAFENYTISQSLLLLVLTYIGGIGMIAGAVVAGFAASGGVFAKVLSEAGIDQFHAIIAGAGLLIAIQLHPDGLASLPEVIRDRVGRRRARPNSTTLPPDQPVESPAAKREAV